MGCVEIANCLEHRAARRLHQLALARLDALRRTLDGPDEAVDARYHVARDHFIAAQLLLARGPVVAEAENGAEAAGELLQLRDLLDRIVGRADDCAAEFGHALGGLVAVAERMPLQAA